MHPESANSRIPTKDNFRLSVRTGFPFRPPGRGEHEWQKNLTAAQKKPREKRFFPGHKCFFYRVREAPGAIS